MQTSPLSTPVDMFIESSQIFTGLNDDVRAGVIVISSGKILSVCENLDEALRLYGEPARMLDVGDAFVCAGLHDAHMHVFHSALYSSPLAVRYRGKNEADCVDFMRSFAQKHPGEGWLLCQGWREAHWSPAQTPSKHSLDEAFPNRPVAMYSGDAHTLWLNTAAMNILDVETRAREAVSAGLGHLFDVDENGELTGIVREAAAMKLMPAIVEGFSLDEMAEAYEQFAQRLISFGITSVGDVSLMAEPGLDFVRDDIYSYLEAQGRLPIRAHMFPTLLDDTSRFDALRASYADGQIVASGFKQFFDGVSSQHTAWLAAPYANAKSPDDCGHPTVDPKVMRDYILKAHAAGWPVRIHAIGDQAIHVALDAFEEAREKFGALPNGRHHCLEHVEGFLPDDIARMGALEVIASVQPVHIMLDPGAPETDLGEERIAYMWPFRSLLDTGAVLAFGTDSPVCDIDPRPNFVSACERVTIPDFEPKGGWVPTERISRAESLRAYTYGSAHTCSRQAELGLLEPGYLADIAIFDTNILTATNEEILNMKTLYTLLSGQIVYQS